MPWSALTSSKPYVAASGGPSVVDAATGGSEGESPLHAAPPATSKATAMTAAARRSRLTACHRGQTSLGQHRVHEELVLAALEGLGHLFAVLEVLADRVPGHPSGHLPETRLV